MIQGKETSLLLGSCLFFLVCDTSLAQEINFSKNIAPIIKSQCSGCHQPGKIAPFSLLSYDDVRKRAKLIQFVIDNNVMPPWPADTSYFRYSNERVLTPREVSDIRDWVSTGMLPGDTSKTNLSYFIEDTEFKEPDYVLFMQKAYHIKK